MKQVIILLVTILLATTPQLGHAQSADSKKGFDYSAHSRTNKKAKHWGHRRMKACRGDMVNLKCTAGQSRRYARKQNK